MYRSRPLALRLLSLNHGTDSYVSVKRSSSEVPAHQTSALRAQGPRTEAANLPKPEAPETVNLC